MRVHLWYPAAAAAFTTAAKSEYTSLLSGKTLYPDLWDPLGWKVEAEIARETDAIELSGAPFPVIVFSHGSTNDPIDYAWVLERIAAAGFVVAAPYHTNNTQDDVRIDFINTQATSPPVSRGRLFPCEDGRPSPCSRNDGAGARSIEDRVRDITYIINALPGWFGGRADATRVGVMGHSRGTITALAAAAGSTAPNWEFGPEPRVKAIMGMAIGARTLRDPLNLAAMTVPVLLVAGGKDVNTVPAISSEAIQTIGSADKRLLVIPNATHRTFDSSYCAQLQSAGALAQANSRAILDRHTLNLIAASPPGGASGKAVHYCASSFFTTPANIEQTIASVPNAEYSCTPAPCHTISSISGPTTACEPGITAPPCTGLDTEEVKLQMADRAVEFFNTRLAVDRDGDGIADATDNCPGAANSGQADADSDGTGDACDPTPYGTTPPELAVPADIIADATGPAGAAVNFTATATDDLDPNPTVTCTPVSGSPFAIGDTRVACEATDRGGNTAHASFVVTVRGADNQLADLSTAVDGIGPGHSLVNKINYAQAALANHDVPGSCTILSAFTHQVDAQSGMKISTATAASLITDATRIQAVLAC